jgi:hypothetical protein
MEGFRKPRCEDCFCFSADPEDHTSGFCHFRPEMLWVRPGHWCSKWRSVTDERFYLWDVPEDVHKATVDP